VRHRKPRFRKARHGRFLAIGDRIRGGIARRSRPFVTIAALAGVVSVGFLATDFYNRHNDSPTNVTDSANAARLAAADRADRSSREATALPSTLASDSPSTSPSTSPSAQASASASSTPTATESVNPTATTPTATAIPTPTKTTKAPTKTITAAWVTPMPGAAVTSCFGMRWGAMHAGVDLAKPENTPIVAAGAGTVTSSGWAFSGYGISVVIDHHNGYFTHYAHMNKAAVSVSQSVTPGQLIGYEGATGDATGPHLHFEVHKGMWNQIEPTAWMKARGVNITC
jgi:murein DD-endopeptidase MepM/ murein hydrolase activator NlpD